VPPLLIETLLVSECLVAVVASAVPPLLNETLLVSECLVAMVASAVHRLWMRTRTDHRGKAACTVSAR
jgi:hypothetical protein